MRDGGGPRVREKPNAPKKGASDARLLRAEGCEVNLSGRRCGRTRCRKGRRARSDNERVDADQHKARQLLNVGLRRRRPGREFALDAGEEAEGAEQRGTVPAASTTYSGMTSFSAALAPTPLASAARPVRT
jgi:hypothetical protein